jgi:hypothetical protein
MLKIIKNNRCAAFTLIEAVVAIVIVMACFWLSGMIYVNLLRADARAEKLRAFAITKSISVESCKNHAFFDETITIDSVLFVKKTIENYNDYAKLKVLNVETFNNADRKLASYKQIVIAE